jgi:phosphoglycolate phosphatase-like HAD superfamily hydrolase
MRVGLDFDNTIVSYDSLFHKVAREGGWIPRDLPPSKLLVRDHLRRIGKEEVWTEMQGLVYGARMAEAESFPGAAQFMRWARGAGIELFIVSHKTRYPFLGPRSVSRAASSRSSSTRRATMPPPGCRA